METALARLRIVLLVPAPPEAGRASDAARDTVAALGHLGSDVDLELVTSAADALQTVRTRGPDLVLLDRASPPEGAAVLASLGAEGPPVVVVTDDEGEDVALEAFRRGAADCVRVGDEYAEVLPVVVLEQVRRFRTQRERSATERQIRDLQRWNENIIRNLNSALLVVDPEGCVYFANPTAEEILCGRQGALTGRQVEEWFGVEDDDARTIARTLSEGLRFKGAETKIRRADGSVVPIGISCAPIELREGAAAEGERGAVAIFQDLSEIKQLQRQVMQSEKMASIGQLAAGIAHEINNPMGFIHANLFQMNEYLGDLRRAWDEVAALQKAVGGGDADDIREAAARLEAVCREVDLEYVQTDFAKAVRESQEGSERIRHIVQDLRDFSHQDTAECSPADVNQCLDSTASIVWTMMKHTVELEKSYADLPAVRCFEMQLKQVLMNLLVNAYQAVEEKLGQQGDPGRKGTIRLRTERAGDGVAISVEDSGVGIASQHLDRIFEPFFTTKEVGAGTGLGLANSYAIVQRHQGRIEVDSEPGRGTTFRVWLPLAGPGPGPEKPA